MRIIQEIGIGLVVHLLDSLTHRHRRRAKIGPVARARGRRLEPLLHIEIESSWRATARTSQERARVVCQAKAGRPTDCDAAARPNRSVRLNIGLRWACGRDAGNSLNPSRIISDRCWIVAHPNQLLHVLHPMGPVFLRRTFWTCVTAFCTWFQGSVLGSDGRIASTSSRYTYSCSSSRKWRT